MAAIVLVACATEQTDKTATTPSQPTPVHETESLEPLATAYLTEEPATEVPTVVPSPTVTRAPTPSFEQTGLGQDFLFANQTSECRLPCWNGLVPGKSTQEDVGETLYTAMGIQAHWREDEDRPGFLKSLHEWEFATGVNGVELFRLRSSVDADTKILGGTLLVGAGEQFRDTTSPEKILEELGPPSNVWVEVQPTEDGQTAAFALIMIYEQGIAAIYLGILLPMSTNQGEMTAELCLGSLKFPVYQSAFVLTTRIPDEFDSYTDFQNASIASMVHILYQPFETVFQMSMNDLADAAQQQDNPCLQAIVP